MNKKSLVIVLVTLLVLVALVAVAVSFLYSDRFLAKGEANASTEAEALSRYGLLQAIPSDASSLMVFRDLKDAGAIIADSTKVLGDYLVSSPEGKFLPFMKSLLSLADRFPALKKASAVLSMHYNGELTPLLIIGLNSSDTLAAGTAAALADSSGLHGAFFVCPTTVTDSSPLYEKLLVEVSPSETIINSSKRHISEGHSILDKVSFAKIASEASGENVLFLCNEDAGILLKRLFTKKYRVYDDFFSNMADWTAFSLSARNDKSFLMKGRTVSTDDPSYYLNSMIREGAASRVSEALPASTVFAVSLPIADFDSYYQKYKKYLDASGRIDKFRSASADLSSESGQTPAQWAKNIGIKEVAYSVFQDGVTARKLLLVSSSVKGEREVGPNKYAGYPSVLFGRLFHLEDESAVVYKNGWYISGSKDDLTAFLKAYNPKSNLSGLMVSSGTSVDNLKDCQLFSYFSISEYAPLLDEVFAPAISAALKTTVSGISYSPASIVVNNVDGRPEMTFRVDRIEVANTSSTVSDTTVNVPKGPFKVTNCGTGQSNYFSQQDNMFLTLSDQNRKGIWSVPFKTPICGKVETIDYFASGKLQFLFASGSKLYLIDRLGRFVSPFPVDLGKDIIIGPAAYDFTGAKGYSVMVLHKDNTIEMYNLKGRKPSLWKGISSKETIKGLPELIEVGNKKYWVVRTSAQTSIYGFYGGSSLRQEKGGKMIRPDSKINVSASSVEVTCFDGKQRNIKLD